MERVTDPMLSGFSGSGTLRNRIQSGPDDLENIGVHLDEVVVIVTVPPDLVVVLPHHADKYTLWVLGRSVLLVDLMQPSLR